MARRFTAERALQILQDLPSSDSEISETDNISDVEIESVSSESSSESEEEITVPPITRVNVRARGRGRGRTTTAASTSTDPNKGRDGTEWSTQISDVRGRIQQQNIFLLDQDLRPILQGRCKKV